MFFKLLKQNSNNIIDNHMEDRILLNIHQKILNTI